MSDDSLLPASIKELGRFVDFGERQLQPFAPSKIHAWNGRSQGTADVAGRRKRGEEIWKQTAKIRSASNYERLSERLLLAKESNLR